MPYASNDASKATAAVNREARSTYAFDDVEDFTTGRRGKITGIPDGKVPLSDGTTSLDLANYAFLDAYAALLDEFDPDFPIVTP